MEQVIKNMPISDFEPEKLYHVHLIVLSPQYIFHKDKMYKCCFFYTCNLFSTTRYPNNICTMTEERDEKKEDEQQLETQERSFLQSSLTLSE